MLAAVCFALCALFGFLDTSGSARISAHEHGVRGKKPEFLDKSPAGDYVQKVGKNILLKCEVLNWQSGWKMTWYKNGKLVQNKRRKIRMRKSQLKIHRLQAEDAGKYECFASNKYGVVSRKLNLTVIGQGFLKDKKPEFIYKSSLYYVKKEGTRIHLKCNVLNWQSSWKMTWYVNGKLIQTKKRKYLIRMVYDGRLRLMIHRVQMIDAGVYKCVASNKYGSVSKELNLTVIARGEHGKGSPWFVVPTSTQPYFLRLRTGTDIKFSCAANGEPPLKYHWLKDGKVLKYRRLDPKFNASTESLSIKTALLSDAGLYKCVARNRLGTISHTIRLNLIVIAPYTKPILSTRFPVNKTARIGENVTFQCVEQSTQLTDYRWLHWNKLPPGYPDLKLSDKDAASAKSSYYTMISPARSRYTSFEVKGSKLKYGGRVLLTNVTKEDEGMYTCLVSNHLGNSWRSAFLKIVTAESYTETHKMKKHLFETAFDDGHGEMACSVSSVLKYPIERKKKGRKRLPAKSRPISVRQFTITLKSVKPKDNETYTCNVSNQQDSINMTYEMHGQVMERPALGELQNVTTNEGKNVTLICKAYNKYKPKLIWFALNNAKKQYNMIQQGKRIELKPVRNTNEGWQGERLRLLNVTSDDSKMYLCLGINVDLSSTESAFVTVLPKKRHSKALTDPSIE